MFSLVHCAYGYNIYSVDVENAIPLLFFLLQTKYGPCIYRIFAPILVSFVYL